MTDQELFDFVVGKLHEQGGPSVDIISSEGDAVCSYRGEHGRKCAAGWLIKDEFYGSGLEGAVACLAHVADALKKSGITNAQVNGIVSHLQAAHDSSVNANEDIADRLTECARAYRLSPAAVASRDWSNWK